MPSETRYGRMDAALEAARRALRVPAYRREWGDAQAESPDEFTRLPFVSKQRLIDGAIERPPFGERLAVPAADVAYTFVSPGPLYLPFTDADLDAAWSATAEALRLCGFGPDDVVDQVVAYHWVAGGTLATGGLRKLGCTVVPAGPGNTDLHLDSIVGLGVTAIVCFPTFLEHLLQRAEERGLELPLRKAAISGELHESDFRARVLDRYGIVTRERYGVAEIGTVAWECEHVTGLHLRDDLLVETVDPESGEPVALDDPEPKELVITDPGREAMPVIRYRTGDLVEALDVEPCACGRTAPRVRRIVGRTGGIPRVKGMFVVPKHVGDVLERRRLKTRYQLRIERPAGQDALTVVLARPEQGLGDVEALKEQLAAALRIRAEIEEVDSLPDDAPLVDDRRAIA
jgi:phenylacetate-CoA ligase